VIEHFPDVIRGGHVLASPNLRHPQIYQKTLENDRRFAYNCITSIGRGGMREVVARRKPGRKPLGPDKRSSEMLTVRVRPDVRRGLERLAKRQGHGLSREMSRAFEHWIDRHHARAAHVEALGTVVAQIAQFIEGATGRRWTEDPYTARAVAHAAG